MSVDFDCVVVGAGVIGLAIARQLAPAGRQVLVLEKASRIGTETSARNSEVIHAGIYYPTGSLKAKFCVEGAKLLYEFCASHGVPVQRIGKLIVATSAAEDEKLHAIAALALANQVTDLQWLSPKEVAQREPELRCTKALYSPSTGIVDAAAYMMALQGDAETTRAVFAMNTSFICATRSDEKTVITTSDLNGELTEITCHYLINCAGHGAHEVAAKFVGYPAVQLPPRFLAKGNYCSVSGKSPFRHLVYPVPVSGALGIHATLDQTGAVRFGPDIQWTDEFNYEMPEDLADKFASAIETYWPSVRSRSLTPSYCGIRPKIHGPQAGFADFMIQQETDHGMPGLTNLFGIESPGLTSSLAIAEYIARNLQ